MTGTEPNVGTMDFFKRMLYRRITGFKFSVFIPKVDIERTELQEVGIFVDDSFFGKVTLASDGYSISVSEEPVSEIDLGELGAGRSLDSFHGLDSRQFAGSTLLSANLIAESGCVVGVELDFQKGKLLIFNLGDKLVAFDGVQLPNLFEHEVYKYRVE